MSKREKLFERFRSSPNDFSWAELESLLGYFGFEEVKKEIEEELSLKDKSISRKNELANNSTQLNDVIKRLDKLGKNQK